MFTLCCNVIPFIKKKNKSLERCFDCSLPWQPFSCTQLLVGPSIAFEAQLVLVPAVSKLPPRRESLIPSLKELADGN